MSDISIQMECGYLPMISKTVLGSGRSLRYKHDVLTKPRITKRCD